MVQRSTWYRINRSCRVFGGSFKGWRCYLSSRQHHWRRVRCKIALVDNSLPHFLAPSPFTLPVAIRISFVYFFLLLLFSHQRSFPLHYNHCWSRTCLESISLGPFPCLHHFSFYKPACNLIRWYLFVFSLFLSLSPLALCVSSSLYLYHLLSRYLLLFSPPIFICYWVWRAIKCMRRNNSPYRFEFPIGV